MEFAFTYRSKVLSRKDLRHELIKIIALLTKNNITSVEILFGVAWGNVYKDWTPFVVKESEINNEIEKAEKLEVGSIGRDDFYIMLPHLETEILICHECDIHLSYNNSNTLVENVINEWKASGIIQTVNNISN
jgi:hypothetical protein